MLLPNHRKAVLPRAKLTEYLLSPTHPIGRGKASFFRAFGFRPAEWERLAMALKRHAADNPIQGKEPSPFGTRYIVDGPLETPDGRDPIVRTVWFIETGEEIPRFVTAYPQPRE